MAYGVAYADVTIPGNFQRLKKQGYATTILMSDVWPLTVPQTADQITNNSQNQSNSTIPVVYLSRIIDEPGVANI